MSDALTELATRVRHLEALETAQVQIGEGPPSHEAAMSMMYWDKTNFLLYANHDGADGWTEIGGGVPAEAAVAQVVGAVTRVACPTIAGNQTITVGLGGRTPNAALFIGCRATTDGAASANASMCYGAATSSTERWAMTQFSEDGISPSNTNRRATTDECVMFIDSTGAIDGEADFVEFVPNGGIIDWTNAPAAAYFLTIVFLVTPYAYAGVVQLAAQDVQVDVTGVGFPFDVLLTGSICTPFDDAAHTRSHLALGAVANLSGTPQYAFDQRSSDNVAASALQSRITDDYGTLEIDAVGAVNYSGEIGNVNSDGFSAWARGGNSASDEVGFLALGFNDAVQFKVGSFSSPVANGDQAITGPGLRPQIVICGLTQMAAFDTAYQDANAGSVGITIFDADNAFCNSIQDEDNQNPTDTQSLSDNQAINFPRDSGAAGYTATFTEFTPTGWIWPVTAQMGTAHLWWYAAIGYDPLA